MLLRKSCPPLSQVLGHILTFLLSAPLVSYRLSFDQAARDLAKK
jgi:hypothetical protein